MAKKTAKKRATKKRTTKKKSGRSMAKNAQCSCGHKMVKQRTVCAKCGKKKPAGGWKDISGSTASKPAAKKTTAPAAEYDIAAITVEAVRRLSDAGGSMTLADFKAKQELTLAAILADDRCPEWIRIEGEEGEFGAKLRELPVKEYNKIAKAVKEEEVSDSTEEEQEDN